MRERDRPVPGHNSRATEPGGLSSMLSLFLCVALLLFCHAGGAVETPEEIFQTQQKIDQLDKQEATPANKQLKEVYQQILTILQEYEAYQEKARLLDVQRKEHPAKIKELKQSLEKPSLPPAIPSFAGISLPELDRMMESSSAEKIGLQNQIDEIQSRLSQLQSRLIPAQNELSEAKKNLDQLGKDSTSAAASQESNLANALLMKKRKTLEARNAQIQYLDRELLSIPDQIELAGLQKEVLSQKLKNINQYQEKLQAQLQQLRQTELETIMDESLQLQKTTNEDPALKWLAEENVAFGDQLKSYVERIQAIANLRSAIEERAKRIEHRHTLLKQELELGGETVGIGELMRETLSRLKSLGIEDTTKTISEIQKGQIQSLIYERQRNEINDKETFVQSVVGRFPDSQLTAVNKGMRERLNSLLDLRLNLINKLLERNQQSLKEWSLMLNAQNQFNGQFQQFNKLLKENLLLTMTNRPMGPAWFIDLFAGFEWTMPREPWTNLAGQFGSFGMVLAGLFLAYLILLFFLRFSLRPRFQIWQNAANENVDSVRRDSFRNTLLMLMGEVLFSLPTPLFLIGLRRISIHYGEGELWSLLLGEGLGVAAIVVFLLGLLRRLSKPDGVFESHLRWPGLLSKTLHREMRFRWLLGLLVAFAYVTTVDTNELFWHEFGRLSFLALCILIASIAAKFTRAWRSSGIESSASWWNINESPHLVGSLFVLSEIWLAVMEIFGFHLGAVVLQGHLVRSLGWTMAIVLAYQLLQRWLLLEQRRLAYARAQAVRAELRAASEGEGGDEVNLESKRREFAEIQSISLQSKTLLKLVCGVALLIVVGWIWSDLIPAFQILDQVALWETTAKGPGGATIETITLKSLVLAMAILGLIVLASRNLPGMVQLCVLPHLKLAPGSDFAVITLLKYTILLAGLVAICQLLGLQWDELQWLIAALSVGLGFGLQEIFANFISGLIILFEKPVRIGDIVTLSNGVTGTIDTINTRATTLTDFDNKEIIIPNKSLITEQLTNWSLTSQVIRLIIPVGIAYGSDTKLAHRLLVQAAEEHPQVLDKPDKAVLFRDFGPSSLNFELRCFVASPGIRLGVIHELNMHIDKLFREHGVEIAFPQMDVHIKDSAVGP